MEAVWLLLGEDVNTCKTIESKGDVQCSVCVGTKGGSIGQSDSGTSWNNRASCLERTPSTRGVCVREREIWDRGICTTIEHHLVLCSHKRCEAQCTKGAALQHVTTHTRELTTHARHRFNLIRDRPWLLHDLVGDYHSEHRSNWTDTKKRFKFKTKQIH